MTNDETLGSAIGRGPTIRGTRMNPIHARNNPEIRKAMAMRNIEAAIVKALKHPEVRFTRDDLVRVADLMGFKLKAKPSNPEKE